MRPELCKSRFYHFQQHKVLAEDDEPSTISLCTDRGEFCCRRANALQLRRQISAFVFMMGIFFFLSGFAGTVGKH